MSILPLASALHSVHGRLTTEKHEKTTAPIITFSGGVGVSVSGAVVLQLVLQTKNRQHSHLLYDLHVHIFS